MVPLCPPFNPICPSQPVGPKKQPPRPPDLFPVQLTLLLHESSLPTSPKITIPSPPGPGRKPPGVHPLSTWFGPSARHSLGWRFHYLPRHQDRDQDGELFLPWMKSRAVRPPSSCHDCPQPSYLLSSSGGTVPLRRFTHCCSCVMELFLWAIFSGLVRGTKPRRCTALSPSCCG